MDIFLCRVFRNHVVSIITCGKKTLEDESTKITSGTTEATDVPQNKGQYKNYYIDDGNDDDGDNIDHDYSQQNVCHMID